MKHLPPTQDTRLAAASPKAEHRFTMGALRVAHPYEVCLKSFLLFAMATARSEMKAQFQVSRILTTVLLE